MMWVIQLDLITQNNPTQFSRFQLLQHPFTASNLQGTVLGATENNKIESGIGGGGGGGDCQHKTSKQMQNIYKTDSVSFIRELPKKSTQEA